MLDCVGTASKVEQAGDHAAVDRRAGAGNAPSSAGWLWPRSFCSVSTSTPGFEQVRGERMPQRVHASPACSDRACTTSAANSRCTVPRTERHLLRRIGEQPGAAADSNASRRAVPPAAAATAAPGDPCVPCPGGRARPCGRCRCRATCRCSSFAQPQAAGIGGLQQHAVAARPGRVRAAAPPPPD